MLTIAIGWAAFAIGAEIVRLDLVSPWLIVHWVLALAGVAMYFLAPRYPSADRLIVSLILAIGLSGVLAQWRTLAELSWVSAGIAGIAMLAIALRPPGERGSPQSGRALAAIGAPILVALWVGRVSHLDPGAHWQFPLAVTAIFAVMVLLVGYRARSRSAGWFNDATDIYAVGFAVLLAAGAAFDIERETAAVLLELICVAALVLIASWNGDRVRVGHWIIPATVIGVALVLQANLLRWLGPPGSLDALDVARMNWPTLVSLLWASIGAALTIWARRVGSRVQWSAGAAFLVGAAIKLLLLDFGSLGELANILAVMAAGGVFLLVGWLAPMPPAAEKPPAAAAPPVAKTFDPGDSQVSPEAPADELPERAGWGTRTEIVASERETGSKFVWTLAIVAFVLISASQCRSRYVREFGTGFTSVEAIDPPMPTTIIASDAGQAVAAIAAAAESVESGTDATARGPIEMLLAQGRLKRATMRDYEDWIAAGGVASRRPVIEDPSGSDGTGESFLLQVYVVQAPIRFSEPLYGEQAVTLIVPRGIFRPVGEAGESEILDMNR